MGFVLVLGIVQSAAGIGPERGEPARDVPSKEILVSLLREREAWLRGRRVLIFQETRFAGGPVRVSELIDVRWEGEREEWHRYDQSSVQKRDVREASLLDKLADARKDGRSPVLSVLDASRTLHLVPPSRDGRDWSGVLHNTVDRAARRGALNSSYLFGERWLSDVISDYELEAARSDSGRFECRFVRRHDASSEELIVALRRDGLVESLHSSKDGRLAMRAETLSTRLVDGELVPSRVEIVYGYAGGAQVRATLEYHPSTPSEMGKTEGIVALPSLLRRSSSSARIEDAATGAVFRISPESEAEPLQGPARSMSRSDREDRHSLPPHSLTIALIALALSCLAWLFKRRMGSRGARR